MMVMMMMMIMGMMMKILTIHLVQVEKSGSGHGRLALVVDFHLHSRCLFVDDYIAMVVKILPFPAKLGAGLEDRTLDANSSKPGNIFLMAMMIIFLHCNQGLFLLLNLSRRVFSTQSNPYQALMFFLHISPTTQ